MIWSEVIVNDTVFAGFVAAITAVVLGLFGWVLSQAVRLGQVVSKLEESTNDHERRLTAIEAQSHGQVRQYEQ